MVFIIMESNGGGVVLVSALLGGRIRPANWPESKYGLSVG
jgi:hypothetical protein